MLYCSCCVTMCPKCSRTQLRASENKSIRMSNMATTRFILVVRSTLQTHRAWVLHQTYHVLWESASCKSSPKSLVGVMRDRRYYRQISRPNSSRKVSNEMIGCLSDHATSVGGYLVTLVSHRPTCPGIRVDSFGALFQHTEVDMLVASRRSESHKISKKILSVQQYMTSACRRNLNDYVTKRTHLPMKLSSDKDLPDNSYINLCK